MRVSADYPDFEAALNAASSQFGATHIVRHGKQATIFSPTSRGYERRTLSSDRGFFHWPRQGDVVDGVPPNAEMLIDVLDVGFDPDVAPQLGPSVKRAAEEARSSDRERWDKLQAEFNRLGDEMTKVESEAHVKWGPHGLRYASRALQTKHEKLKAARNRVFEKMFAMTQRLSPRDWGSGVPAHWVAGKLTFDDMVRPQSEPLSVTPPLAYGATTPMKETGEARSLKLWKYNRITGLWVYQREVSPEEAERWLAIFQKDEPGETFKVSANRPSHKGAREMGAVREVLENRGREGRHYESSQWLEFECEPATPTPELEEKAREFKKLVLEFLESYARTWSIDTGSLDEDSFVWNAYASLVGHGVGLWEGDGDTGLRGEDEKKIDKALRGRWAAPGSAVGRLHSLAHQISDECSMLSEGAGGREASEEASIPTKAQLRIINAFREHRLMGNPMRDSISTDGDTIYSYRMPIARRTSNGGIAIVDPASAPSATTRNHIYGLQRTFTPAEIAGTRAAEENGRFERGDDVVPARVPDSEITRDNIGVVSRVSRAGVHVIWTEGGDEQIEGAHNLRHYHGPVTGRNLPPELGPGAREQRLQSGYAFYTPSRRKGDWKKIPNDDWEPAMVSNDEIEKATFVGSRAIDGYVHDIFEMVFARGRGGRGYYAQLQTHTRGRGAAHESAVLLDHMANDFMSPKEAIEYAQRTWGASHVDFHGTRTQPTVYGIRAGARWKKTLYKEKGKYHWPDKFLRGPKKLRGAIELTPVAMPTHAPAPMHRPPMSPVVPGTPDDFERHLPMHSDEADRRYTTKQSPKDALRDDVFFEGLRIGHIRGPFRSSSGDFYEWQISRRSGRAKTRRAALSDVVRAHKATTDVREVRENPATDLQNALPWIRVTKDPEKYKIALERARAIGPIDDAKKVYELVGPALLEEDQETFIVVALDVRQNCRGVAEIHRGARSRVAVSVLDVMRVVVASGAEGFIVCHNHPSGKAMPSDADRSLTKAIERSARPFKGETMFLDHVVCGAGEYFSFADNKLHRAKG